MVSYGIIPKSIQRKRRTRRQKLTRGRKTNRPTNGNGLTGKASSGLPRNQNQFPKRQQPKIKTHHLSAKPQQKQPAPPEPITTNPNPKQKRAIEQILQNQSSSRNPMSKQAKDTREHTGVIVRMNFFSSLLIFRLELRRKSESEEDPSSLINKRDWGPCDTEAV